MSLSLDSVKEFQKRRKEAWAAARPWLILLLGSAIGGLFITKADGEPLNDHLLLSILVFAGFAVSILRLTYVVKAKYCCPVCGKVPMQGASLLGPSSLGHEEGVDLNPTKCSHCGAQLK